MTRMEIPANPNSPEQTNPQNMYQVDTNSVYDQGSNVFSRIWGYFVVKIWPPTSRIFDGTVYFLFKVLRGIFRFALVQMGIRSGD